jgi:hypothetical protein
VPCKCKAGGADVGAHNTLHERKTLV